MASPLTNEWLFATVPIDNPQGGSGTGFLVARDKDDGQGGRVFVATNKHVVHPDPAKRASVPHLKIHFNTRKDEDGALDTNSAIIPLVQDDGAKRYREHPDPDVDVFALEVSDVMWLNPSIKKRWVKYDLFVDDSKREELDITVGEEVVTIGYPLGLRQGNSNLPLLRQGMIATPPGAKLTDRAKNPDGSIRERTIPAFLIDGATVPGSSGSPVVLKPVLGRPIKGKIKLTTAPPVLLGIVAETKYAPISTAGGVIPGFSDLGLVFDASTIRETVELFF